jgi:hypothetical protein
MPLSTPGTREALQSRRIEMNGFRRSDGMFEVEAYLTDIRAKDFEIEYGRRVEAGQPLHDMAIRLVIDSSLTIIDVEASIDSSPFTVCHDASSTLKTIKGLRIGPGWSAMIRERLSGARGCTHLRELLGPLATVAIQSLYEVRQAQPEPVDAAGKPRKVNSCFAYAQNREIVMKRWPEYFRKEE